MLYVGHTDPLNMKELDLLHVLCQLLDVAFDDNATTLCSERWFRKSAKGLMGKYLGSA